MCVVSMVYDHFRDRFPQPQPFTNPTPNPLPWPMPGSLEFAELRKLIQEFREAVEAAKKVDVLTKQPDCADPEKATLEKRVAELERRLDAMGGT
jgi:hypothetical protein